MSPRRMISLTYPFDARSINSADKDSLRLSKTPTTTQALRCFSGLPLFMVNSIAVPSLQLLGFFVVTRNGPHYWQNGPKKSKFSRRHDLPAQPGARDDGDGHRPVPRPARNPVHQSRAAPPGACGGGHRRARRAHCAAWVQRPVLFQYSRFRHGFRHGAADARALVSRQRDDRLVFLRRRASPTACARSFCLRRPFSSRSSCCRCFCRLGPIQRKLEYERQLESRDEIALITPGLFREFRRANLVVFVESINTLDGTIRNVFLHSVEDGKDCDHGRAIGVRCNVAPNGDRFIVLDDGRRYEGKPGSTEYRIVEFGRLGRRIEPAELRALPIIDQGDPHRHALALDGPLERAELFWRLSIPIAAMVLTLLAVPLAYVNPRIGTSFNLIAAVFLYMLYSNCLNIVQSFIAQGKLGFLPGLASFRTRSRSASCCFLYGHQLLAVRTVQPSGNG